MSDRLKPINYLKKYIGIKEGSPQHLAILDVFNKSGLCKRYKMTPKDAWCATGVSAAFIATDLTKVFPCVECSCENMIKKAKTVGLWKEKDSYVPDPGDVIFYDWDDSGKGDNTGFSDHVGFVESVDDGMMHVLECNYKDSVGYRNIAINGKYIRGFIVPKYKDDEPKKPTVKPAVKKPEVKPAVKKPAVKKPEVKKTESADLNKTERWEGIVTASALNVRSWAGKSNALCSFGPITHGKVVSVCDSVTNGNEKWFYIRYNGKYGFVLSDYIKRK